MHVKCLAIKYRGLLTFTLSTHSALKYPRLKAPHPSPNPDLESTDRVVRSEVGREKKKKQNNSCCWQLLRFNPTEDLLEFWWRMHPPKEVRRLKYLPPNFHFSLAEDCLRGLSPGTPCLTTHKSRDVLRHRAASSCNRTLWVCNRMVNTQGKCASHSLCWKAVVRMKGNYTTTMPNTENSSSLSQFMVIACEVHGDFQLFKSWKHQQNCFPSFRRSKTKTQQNPKSKVLGEL